MTTLLLPTQFDTDRLLLRPVADADAKSIFNGYASSEKATRLMDFPRHLEQDDSDRFVERCLRWKLGAGEGIRTLDPNLGNEKMARRGRQRWTIFVRCAPYDVAAHHTP